VWGEASGGIDNFRVDDHEQGLDLLDLLCRDREEIIRQYDEVRELADLQCPLYPFLRREPGSRLSVETKSLLTAEQVGFRSRRQLVARTGIFFWSGRGRAEVIAGTTG